MKSKISKILSVFVVLATIVALFAATTALPTSAAVTTPDFNLVTPPSAIGNVLIAGTTTTGVYAIAGTPDGSTLFAWANTAAGTYLLYKSTNFGATWTNTGAVGAGLTTTWTPVALLVSPKFATDSTVVFVTTTNAYISSNGGVSFAAAPAPDATDGGSITSADIGTSYTTGAVTIVIGLTAAGAGAQSNVKTFAPNTNAYTWTEVGGLTAVGVTLTYAVGAGSATSTGGTAAGYNLIAGQNLITVGAGTTLTFTFVSGTVTASGSGLAPGTVVTSGAAIAGLTAGTLTVTYTPLATTAVGDLKVYGVKFSANYSSDAEIVIVANSAGGATLGTPTVYSSFNGSLFNTANGLALPGTVTTAPTGAVLAMGTDYNGMSGSNTFAVGLNGLTVTNPGLYQITGRTSTSAGTATNINTALKPTSIAISPAPIAGATLLVGSSNSSNIAGYTAFTAATPTALAIAKQPSGSVSASVIWGGTKAFAGTVGTDGGFSASTDGAVTFTQLSLVNVGTVASMSLAALTVADTNNLFLLMGNTSGGYATKQLWGTADGGATWKRTLLGTLTFTPASVWASPAFATDKTVFVSQLGAGSNIAKSIDGGNTFSFAITAAVQTGISPINGTNFYYGGAGVATFYKYPNFASATFPVGATGTVFSIAVNPKDATNIAVGMSDANVYMSTDSGATFTKVGGAISTVGQNVYVAFGPAGTLYAEGGAAAGIQRWIPASSTWFVIQALTGGTGSGLAVGADGTLYAADSIAAAAGHGIFRSLNPTLGNPIAGNGDCQFQNLISTQGFSNITAASTFVGMSVVSSTAANTFYTLDTAFLLATSGYGYNGALFGFNDTFIGAPTLTSPADKAQVADQTSTVLTWAAFTGATKYEVAINPASDFSGTAIGITDATTPSTTSTSATTLTLTAGSTYYWKVRANSQQVGTVTTNLYSRWATVRSFVTTLPAVGGAAPLTLVPVIGSTTVAVDGTFSWPTVAGATSYDFVLAEDQGTANHFAIIDFGDTTSINAYKLKEPLKYSTAYWWEVRANTATSTGAWTVGYFTTAAAPTSTTTSTSSVVTPTVTVINTNPGVTPTVVVTVPPSNGTTTPVIPTYLLWLVIVVGAVLVIAVIVLIVRTRRIS
jgi:hypothetical protein